MSLEVSDDPTIYSPTARGKAELKAGSTRLSTVALELMVMFDGKSPLSTIASRMADARPGEIGDAVEALLRDKFIDAVRPGQAADMDLGDLFEVPVDAMPDSDYSGSFLIHPRSAAATASGCSGTSACPASEMTATVTRSPSSSRRSFAVSRGLKASSSAWRSSRGASPAPHHASCGVARPAARWLAFTSG
jgi:hypothetical protein